jgi:tetrapyrrole methylase family protein/MazG family protein
MNTSGITLLGLGPGNPDLLTRQAWHLLENISEIYLRTKQHPVVGGFPAGLQTHSFDYLYEQEGSFENVYTQIIERVLELGLQPEGVVYGVPGHPFIAEATGPEIAVRANEAGIPLKIIDGLSFLEPVMTALKVDPLPHTALVDALELAIAHVPPFPPSAPAIVAQLHSKFVASDVKLTLMSIYPDDHTVQLIHAAGTSNEKVESLVLYEIDRSDHIGLLTSLYVPPIGPATSFEEFQEVIAHLRAPEGCPWDREQTHQTLRPHLLEEAYEVISALDANDPDAMREEFGDLLLQIILHAQIANEYGEFNISDVLEGIHTKIVYRHPHVFGNLELKEIDGVLLNWERMKAEERVTNGKREESLLNGVAKALPALIQAEQFQKRASRVGFDWKEIQGVIDKVEEEMSEVHLAQDSAARAVEIGDLIFAVVNLARWYDVDAESALREANTRFRSRFNHIEQVAHAQGRSISDLALDEMESLWRAAKRSM